MKKKNGRIVGLLGLSFTIVGILVTIYYEVIKKEEPLLEYSIIAKTDLFNNNENIENLKVFIDDSIDVQKKHLNITTYNIKVENKGSKHISESDYAKGFFGLKIEQGIILNTPTLINASNQYLDNMFSVDSNAKGGCSIELPKVIIDKNDSYIIRVVLLHDIDTIPRFNPEGKIVGQKNIEIKESIEENANMKSTVLYSILLGIMLSVLVYWMGIILGDVVAGKKELRRKKKQQKELYQQRAEDVNNLVEVMPAVKEEYIENGYWAIALLDLILNDKEESRVSEDYRKMTRYIRYNTQSQKNDYKKVKGEYDLYNHYIEKGFFLLNNDYSITFNAEAKLAVKKTHEFLRKKTEDITTQKSLSEILNSFDKSSNKSSEGR